jgi:hypothetical protein
VAVDMCILTFLKASGSPFSSRCSVGQCLWGPSTMLGPDRSRIASDLSSGSGMEDRGKDSEEKTAWTGDRRGGGESSLLAGSTMLPGSYI